MKDELKKANHWYLAGQWVAAVVGALYGLMAMASMAFAVATGRADFFALLAILGVVILLVAIQVVVGRRRASVARTLCMNALKAPSPEELVAWVVRVFEKLRSHRDHDAMQAGGLAVAYALYGCEHEAVSALAKVDWNTKAPVIQANGLRAECFVEILCRRNAKRALESALKARSAESMSRVIPAAAKRDLSFASLIALCEALLGTASPAGLRVLEESTVKSRDTQWQLLASFGLAVAMERSGDTERALQLREFIASTAPHCAPLRMTAADFEGAEPPDEGTGPVLKLEFAQDDHSTVERQRRLAGKRILITVGVVLAICAASGVLFSVIWASLSSDNTHQPSSSEAREPRMPAEAEQTVRQPDPRPVPTRKSSPRGP